MLRLVIFGTLLLAGCGESVDWVDQPKQSAKCNGEELDAVRKFPEMKARLGKNICQGARKGEFTGEIRCEGDSFQVACKAS